MEYEEISEQQEVEEAEDKETLVDTQQETEPEPKEEEVPPLISTDQTEDLLGLNEINSKAAELEESNALALAIVPPAGDKESV
ncbi:putative clathrin assembly protein At4g25940 isoform X1 [Camellia sinensis]|uniref:putative clathrin assembly protein At4g25940 isoform X1 n=1 Tax=Camellia sinensis TaxID=4442 RepID=UPI001036EF8D|nr:putative clathrin assembly protein At4g25940 isoform X1 [Camellia sinensis]